MAGPRSPRWSEGEPGHQGVWDIAMAHFLQEGVEGSRTSEVPASPNSPKLLGTIGRGLHTMSFLGPWSPTADPGPLGHDSSMMRMEWEVGGGSSVWFLKEFSCPVNIQDPVGM